MPVREEGTKIGQYTVVKRIGEGGMGVVFKVANEEGKHFAVKVLRQQSSSQLSLRFKREIEILQELNCPNIPKVYDIGEYEGKPYFVMEYIEGTSLLVHLAQKKKLREREAVQIMHKVATVIAQAHKLGIIHRDIKPENIMLVGKEPYIMDFGVALHEKEDTLRLTKTGTFIGTPNYAPPEQVFGKKKLIGEWTDVYAMGTTLYHLLTGVVPFYADSDVKTIMNIANHNLAPLRKYNSQISEKVELVVKKATEKSIKRRYHRARDFAEDLYAILHKKPISIKPLPPLVRFLQKRWQVLLFILTLLAVVLVLLWPGGKGKEISKLRRSETQADFLYSQLKEIL